MYLQMFDEVVLRLRFSFPANNVSIQPRPLPVTSMVADSANFKPAITLLPTEYEQLAAAAAADTFPRRGLLVCSLHCFSFIHLMFN